MNSVDMDINRFLPHRGRMRLVDDIIEIDESRAVTRSTVTDQWPLSNGESVNSIVLIELAAQTAGIRNTWEGIKKHGTGFQTKGWLVGVKKCFFFTDVIPLGAQVTTTCRNEFGLDNYREILGTVSLKRQIIGEITLQLLQSD